MNFILRQVFVYWDVVLALVGFHPFLKSVIVNASFRSDSDMIVIEKLNALHVMLESSIGKLGYVYCVWKS